MAKINPYGLKNGIFDTSDSAGSEEAYSETLNNSSGTADMFDNNFHSTDMSALESENLLQMSSRRKCGKRLNLQQY